MIRPRVTFAVRRRHLPGTVVLETESRTATGVCLVIDCLVIEDRHPTLIRRAEGDPRIAGTVARIERTLMRDGLVLRCLADPAHDGLPGGEGVFLACPFWRVDNYLLLGRRGDAERLFARRLGLCNDVGLLSEECDPQSGRRLGNFPQALSHIAPVNTAANLSRLRASADDRGHM